MRKFATASSLTVDDLSPTPIRVRTKGMNLFDVSIGKFTLVEDIKKYNDCECFVVRRLNTGHEFRSETLEEAKKYISVFL